MNTKTVVKQQDDRLGLSVSADRIKGVIQKALNSKKGLRLTLKTVAGSISNSRVSITGIFHCAKNTENLFGFAVNVTGVGRISYTAANEKDRESFFAWLYSVEASPNNNSVPELVAGFHSNYC